jgi:predicted dehydrogenase
MPPLSIAVLGLRAGFDHARQIAECPRTKLAAVADLREDLRTRAQEELGAPETYETYEELIEKCGADAIAVALPVPLHYPAAMAALKAGKHVLSEKPPADDARQTKRLVEQAARQGLQLSWGLQVRFMPESHVARRELSKGKLGHVYRVDGKHVHARAGGVFRDRFRMLKQGGGVFMDLGVHSLDQAWSLLGFPKPTRVVAALHTAFPHWNLVEQREDMADDNAFAMVFFETGQVVTVEAAYVCNRHDAEAIGRSMMVYGDKGGLHLPSLAFSTGHKAESRARQGKYPRRWDAPARRQMYANFADAVAGRDELLIKPEQGVELMKMVDAAIESGDTGREVKLK